MAKQSMLCQCKEVASTGATAGLNLPLLLQQMWEYAGVLCCHAASMGLQGGAVDSLTLVATGS